MMPDIKTSSLCCHEICKNKYHLQLQAVQVLYKCKCLFFVDMDSISAGTKCCKPDPSSSEILDSVPAESLQLEIIVAFATKHNKQIMSF